MIFLILFLIILGLFGFCLHISFIDDKENKKQKSPKIDDEFVKKHLKTYNLSEEEVKEIHSRGKLTPEEMVKEWESWDLCAPGDFAGSAAWRCKKFKNCHECLLDYASETREHTSIMDDLKIICK